MAKTLANLGFRILCFVSNEIWKLLLFFIYDKPMHYLPEGTDEAQLSSRVVLSMSRTSLRTVSRFRFSGFVFECVGCADGLAARVFGVDDMISKVGGTIFGVDINPAPLSIADISSFRVRCWFSFVAKFWVCGVEICPTARFWNSRVNGESVAVASWVKLMAGIRSEGGWDGVEDIGSLLGPLINHLLYKKCWWIQNLGLTALTREFQGSPMVWWESNVWTM